MSARGGADGLLLVEACRGLQRERAGRFGEVNVCVSKEQEHAKALGYLYARVYRLKENCVRIVAGKVTK